LTSADPRPWGIVCHHRTPFTRDGSRPLGVALREGVDETPADEQADADGTPARSSHRASPDVRHL
ncbi:hypothetical protein, partial [Luedemannella helvata]|uniref:hypothetical protein n=1 Tax=Luedemannella helvata TaxID=349315 RepID=UPI0031DDAB2C